MIHTDTREIIEKMRAYNSAASVNVCKGITLKEHLAKHGFRGDLTRYIALFRRYGFIVGTTMFKIQFYTMERIINEYKILIHRAYEKGKEAD